MGGGGVIWFTESCSADRNLVTISVLTLMQQIEHDVMYHHSS